MLRHQQTCRTPDIDFFHDARPAESAILALKSGAGKLWAAWILVIWITDPLARTIVQASLYWGRAVENLVSAEEWKTLSPAQRVDRCVGYASEASGLAGLATHPEIKERYLTIAGQWLNLADEIQRSAGE